MDKLSRIGQMGSCQELESYQSKFEMVSIARVAVKNNASDIHISVGLPPMVRIDGKLTPLGKEIVKPGDSYQLIKQVLSPEQFEYLQDKGEFDLSYSDPLAGRMRVNAFKQRGSFGLVMRTISSTIPSMEDLGLPAELKKLTDLKRGLILVTGPTGSGKSTTLASMIDYMNHRRNGHVITIEDPIEYLHRHGTCLINQREVGGDTLTFANALRAALRQDPDIILVGEMRDPETIATAITAAETGHLVLSTLHTIGAVKTMDRIIDSFPPYQQQQIKVQLAGMIEAVISQQLLPKASGSGRIVALEIMTATPAIRNLIREGKTHQMQSIIQTGSKNGMITMDRSLIDLYRAGKISLESLRNYAVDEDAVAKELQKI